MSGRFIFPTRNFRDPPVERFSNLSLHQNCPKNVLKTDFWAPLPCPPEVLMSRSGWGLSICSYNKFQVVLTPLSGVHTLRTAVLA